MTHLKAWSWPIGVAVLLLGAAGAPWSAGAQALRYSGSAQYSTGSYIFSERTHTVSLSNGLSLSTERVNVSASLPLIYQSTPWISYTTFGGVPSGGPQQGAVRGRRQGTGGGGMGAKGRMGAEVVIPDTASYEDIGIGDPSARADVTVIQSGENWPRVSIAASAKAPVADVDQGFGTGSWDAGLGLGLSKRFGSWFLFSDALYWWMGDMEEIDLQNSVAYSVSVGRVVRNGAIGLLASITGYTAEIVEGVDPPAQAGLGVNYSFAEGRYSLSGNASFGLTEATPGASFGMGWSAAL